MSSKAKKLADNIPDGTPAQDLRTVPFKVLFNIDGDDRYTVVYVSGVPKDIDDDDPTIKHAAEQMFVNAINSRMFLEMYQPDQDSKADYPHFKNLSRCDNINVMSVERIK